MPGKKTHTTNKLIDSFGRIHSYLRLSITENCNFRCMYCMPDSVNCANSKALMTPDEIYAIAEIFVNLGVSKIRLTGGEPLVREDFGAVVKKLGSLSVTKAITTNGFLLGKYFSLLKDTDFTNLNISLDSLNPENFLKITSRNSFYTVHENILLAIHKGFNVKINVVVMKGINDNELVDFARLSLNLPVSVRFIEFMPFRANNWNFNRTVKQAEIIDLLRKEFVLEQFNFDTNSAASYFKIPESAGTIGVIGTVSEPFCDSCNRLRITADGKIKSCLFGHTEFNLLQSLRRDEDLEKLIHEALCEKPFQHGNRKLSHLNTEEINLNRSMFSIGG